MQLWYQVATEDGTAIAKLIRQMADVVQHGKRAGDYVSHDGFSTTGPMQCGPRFERFPAALPVMPSAEITTLDEEMSDELGSYRRKVETV